jgi:hypothetical protein
MKIQLFFTSLLFAVYNCQQTSNDPYDGVTEETIKEPLIVSSSAQNTLVNPTYRPLVFQDFYVEMILGFIVLVYVLVQLRGSKMNRELARKWMRGTLSLWEKNFAQVGDEMGHKLMKDGPSDYIFYASGRRYVRHVYGFIEVNILL